jgi:sterol desaturase/sphingolipid hydroxylase (fatty acid hydroxylase superfamily)
MLDFKTVLLIFGIVFLFLVLTRKAIRKQKAPSPGQGKSAQPAQPVDKPRMTEEQFMKSWKGLSYLLLLAAAGNLYMAYNSLTGALETQSYILWMDVFFSLAAAVTAFLLWLLHRRKLVILYLVITILPIMLFISTGHALDGLMRLFPLVLVYFVVQPVWEYLE